MSDYLTLGVVGNPILHSLSPLIHRTWLRDLGINGGYMALRVDEGAFQSGMPLLEQAGYMGLNITLPHKHAAYEYADSLTPHAKAIGAVNTLSRRDGNWHGDNTDAPGVIAAISEFMPEGLQGKTVLLIGAGGAARGVAYALNEAGANLIIANRTVEKAQDLAARYGEAGRHTAQPLSELTALARQADMIINTTSIGHSGEVLQLGTGQDRPFYDISYGRAAEAQMKAAEADGWACYDGLTMLVYQAAFSFEIWTGQKPDIERALVQCHDALTMAEAADVAGTS